MNGETRLTRRRFLSEAARVAVGFGAVMSAPLRGVSQGGHIKIALITDLTGSNQRGGRLLEEGTRLAVEVVNEAGGIGGRYEFDLVVEDAKTSPTEAVTAANRLIHRGDIGVVIGPMLTNEILPIQPLFAAARIPHIMVGSTDRTLTDRHDAAPLSLRYSPQDIMQMAPMAKYAVTENAHETFFALAVDTGDGRAAIAAFEDALRGLGGELAAREFYPFLHRDFSTLVAKFRASDADALIVSDGVPATVIALFEEFVRQGLALERFYGSIVFGGPTFFDLVASQGRADGMIFPWFYDDGTSRRAFEGGPPPQDAVAMSRAFQNAFGQPPGPAAFVRAWGWGSVQLVKQALERLMAEEGEEAIMTLDPVRELPQTMVNEAILKGATGTETGPKFQLTFGDELGFFACGQGDVRGGPATYENGERLLLADRHWSDDLVAGLCP